jgi:zinc transport system ATP-binding protein
MIDTELVECNTMKQNAITASDVTVSFEGLSSPALDHVNCIVNAGEITALVGPNGSGKTTFLRAIAGLIPYKGEISIFGKPAGSMHQIIGYVPQRFSFDISFPVTVGEFLSLALWDKPQHQKRDLMTHALFDVGASGYASRLLSSLSGGQLQRVLLARALSRSPSLVLLDEPEAGVDKGGEQIFYELLTRLSKRGDLTVVVASHELDLVFAYAQQVLCINRSIFCSGPPKDVLKTENLEKLYGHDVKAFGHTHHHEH